MTGLDNKSIASIIAEKIVDFSEATAKTVILDDLSLYGSSEKDGSATLTLEWHGDEDACALAHEVLEFLYEVKKLVIDSGKEVKEQLPPHLSLFNKDPVLTRAVYRFRIWPTDGKYEVHERDLVTR